ncbi:MAG: HAMP domain-containing histidine kinase [Saprospiraceae bacterium]|nr:HAMP domain-containing histidine kinase [Saprospiraceae bacterium]
MRIRRQYRPLWFIITSLALLGIFLIYWLYTVWTELYGSVYGETDYWSGEMVPYILVAFLLMGVIVISFGMLLRNLRREYQLGKLKNDFISSMSHELRSPIATISIALETLSVDDDPAGASAELLRVSKLELERLNLLVDRVLRLSMFEDREPALYPEPLDMYQIVQQVVLANRLRAERKQAVITLLPENPEIFMLSGDRIHLTSIVFNLLDNSLKYVSRAPRIRVELSRNEKMIVLRITDNGIGIAPEHHQKVFEKFFRVPVEKGMYNSGHGLGLSYVSNVILQHGGTISLESQPGKGSTFIIELPAL